MSRFSQRLRNKHLRNKKAEVPQNLFQHTQSPFLAKNQEPSTNSGSTSIKRRRIKRTLLLTVNENGQHKKPNEKEERKKKTAKRTERLRFCIDRENEDESKKSVNIVAAKKLLKFQHGLAETNSKWAKKF